MEAVMEAVDRCRRIRWRRLASYRALQAVQMEWSCRQELSGQHHEALEPAASAHHSNSLYRVHFVATQSDL